ncbi:peptidase S8 family protein [Metarhizium robertsii]|nr:peptidase S8 family protein [Metarhizium robertsii]
MLEARLEQRLEQLSTTLEQAEEGHLTGARPGASSDEGIRESVQHRVIQPVKENEYTAFLATHVQTREPNSNWTAVTAKSFFRSISSFNRDFILEDASPRLEPWARRRTRVAIIDSGIISCENKQHLRKLDPMICAAGERIINRRSWVGVESDCNDECGHGTHVVRQLLEVAPRAELVIAKVASNTENIPLSYVAKAIEWAVDDNDVDIVALSLGVSQDDKHINTVLDRILNLDGKQTGQVSNGVKGHRRRIVFAAAGNHGGNRMRASPARRRGVICVHAADGEGDTKSFNPDPDHEWEDNFSTLGVDIVSLRQGESVYISGTSYATPIAAGIAANMLHFARNQPGMREEDKNLLHSYFGMRQIFKRISFPRGNYDYICPWRRKDRMANQPDEATDMSLSELLWSSIGVAREEARKAEAL